MFPSQIPPAHSALTLQTCPAALRHVAVSGEQVSSGWAQVPNGRAGGAAPMQGCLKCPAVAIGAATHFESRQISPAAQSSEVAHSGATGAATQAVSWHTWPAGQVELEVQ
jgi:hypothetical protein